MGKGKDINPRTRRTQTEAEKAAKATKAAAAKDDVTLATLHITSGLHTASSERLSCLALLIADNR